MESIAIDLTSFNEVKGAETCASKATSPKWYSFDLDVKDSDLEILSKLLIQYTLQVGPDIMHC